MALRWYTVVIDCHDIAAQARWWAQTLDFQIVYEDEHEVAVIPKHMSEDVIEDGATWMRQAQGWSSCRSPRARRSRTGCTSTSRRTRSQDRDAEIAALLERGATLADVGQGDDVTWTVLADPEGNEFCVLSAIADAAGWRPPRRRALPRGPWRCPRAWWSGRSA